MAETRPPRGALLRAITEALAGLDPPLTAVAERVLGLEARIDLVARDERGGVGVVCIAAAGEDLARFTDALAQRAWLQPRLADWKQLAPQQVLDPARGVRALLLAPDFDARTRAAAGELGPETIELIRYRSRPSGASWTAELESVVGPAPGPGEMDLVSAPESRFRTGLEEEDLTPLPMEAQETR